MVYFCNAKNINLDEGRIGKVEMSPVNSLERFFPIGK